MPIQVMRLNTNRGKSPALFNGGLLLVDIKHMHLQYDTLGALYQQVFGRSHFILMVAFAAPKLRWTARQDQRL